MKNIGGRGWPFRHSLCERDRHRRARNGNASEGRADPSPEASPSCQELEVEAELRRVGSRRDEVRPAERRQEVKERGLVRQVDDREAQAPLVAITMKQVVIAHAGVKQIAWHHPRW